ncbi:MAG: hypothetical protein QOD98_1978 [Nocardioidaceae bacterium]|jgi:membrane-associated phospholipid phosphatase|nr:hypothetical protein [Nocardioidaceae bacterium]
MRVAGAFLAVYAVGVWTPAGQLLDQQAMRWVAAHTALDSGAALVLGALTATTVAVATAALVLVALAVHGARRALVVGLAPPVVLALARLLKLFLERPDLLPSDYANSFPSGHVAAVAAVAASVALALPDRFRGRALATLLAVPVAVTAVATVVLRWHRPSDTLGGALLAVLVGCVGCAATRATTAGEATEPVPAEVARA